jgi:hypothetical protein
VSQYDVVSQYEHDEQVGYLEEMLRISKRQTAETRECLQDAETALAMAEREVTALSDAFKQVLVGLNMNEAMVHKMIEDILLGANNGDG